MTEAVVDLNQFEVQGVITCPYCIRGKVFSYGAKGLSSQTCSICKNIMLCDFDRMKAYRANTRKLYNKSH